MTPASQNPKRFEPSKGTLLVDRFMTHFIKVGGILVITAVLGIFLFILAQILPLFQSAKVTPRETITLPEGKYTFLGADERSELPFVVDAQGNLVFIDLNEKGKIIKPELGFEFPAQEGNAAAPAFTAINFNSRTQELIYGTANGLFSIVSLNYGNRFENGSQRTTQNAKAAPFMPLGTSNTPIYGIDFGDSGDSKLIAGIQQAGDQAELHAVRLTRKRSLLGAGKAVVDRTYNLTSLLSAKPVQILVTAQADGIIVAMADGAVEYLFRNGEEFELRQKFQPFKDLQDPGIASIDFLFGDVSLVITSVTGENKVFSLLREEGKNIRTFVHTKTFDPLPGAASFYNSSLRNKAFLTGSGSTASLRYSTTETIRWEEKLPFTIEKGIIGGKYDRLLFVDNQSKLHIYELNDPHPETSFKALFGKIWYEGYPAPGYEWQSTGGSDDFEAKFSLVPLIIGTIKGTIYAMLFAVPIALLAAIYTSQFLHPDFRAVVKPTMEIMASLPSVVLGFLAALWLAPIIDTRVPSILLIVIFIPLAAVGFGYFWSSLPIRYRILIKPGYEFFVFFPILLILLYAAWVLGPTVEQYLFVVTDPSTGKSVADFRLWWPHVTGTTYEQRNSLVVGFMMGFAVIPIVFTIAEDALSNVPNTLRSASLALGASRWQTAIRVIVPTASAGIFSALMIGLGRAVGETMIVLMATGNTPIMDMNIFSGMRTLSANIAVELPEAPHHSTLYRTLFLGAMLLFMMTFLVNTVAEVLRQHLREKYKTV